MLGIYRTYYHFLFKYRWQFVAFILASFFLTLSESIQPYFYKLFIDTIGQSDQSILMRLVFIYIIIRFLGVVFDVITGYFGDSVVIPAARDARLAIFKKVQDLDFAYHLSKSTGSLISAFRRGDGAFFDFHHTVNGRLFRAAMSFFILLFFFSQINWTITLLMFISFALNLLLAKLLIKKNIKARSLFNQSEDRLSDIIVDNLINYETVKLFAKESKEYQRLDHQFVDWSKKLWGYAYSFRVIDISIGGLANTGLFLILLFGLTQITHQVITPSQYVMILGFVNTFYPKFFEVLYDLRSVAKHQVDMERYFAILDQSIIVKDPPHPVKKTDVEGKIEFKNISFTYPEGKKNAIKDINLVIRPGQSVAFVGHSGVGKTTIIKLLMRFYDPKKGQILLDDINIKRFTKDQLRSFMGVVPQEPILFNDSIGYNIGYGADTPSQEQIVAAAKMANLDDFIESLPKKYDTIVGERGVKLSGGQKQRLAIARMILSDPDIVIFDEATSQLDSESEQKIQDAFWKAVKNKTTLIVAHRLSTISRAEKIVVMQQGTIKEIGSHRQLLSDPHSLYSHFWQLQSAKVSGV